MQSEQSPLSPAYSFTPGSSRDSSPYTTLVRDMQNLGGGNQSTSSSMQNLGGGSQSSLKAMSPQQNANKSYLSPGTNLNDHRPSHFATPKVATSPKLARPSKAVEKTSTRPAAQTFSKKPEKSVIDDDLMSDVFNELAILEETIRALESEAATRASRSRTTSLSSQGMRSPSMSDSFVNGNPGFCCSPPLEGDASSANQRDYPSPVPLSAFRAVNGTSSSSGRVPAEYGTSSSRTTTQQRLTTHSNQFQGHQQTFEEEEEPPFPPPPPNPELSKAFEAYDLELLESSLSPLPPPPAPPPRGSDNSTNSYGHHHGNPPESYTDRDTDGSSSPHPYQDGESERSSSPAYYHRWASEQSSLTRGANIKPGLRLLADVLKKPKPKASLLHAPHRTKEGVPVGVPAGVPVGVPVGVALSPERDSDDYSDYLE